MVLKLVPPQPVLACLPTCAAAGVAASIELLQLIGSHEWLGLPLLRWTWHSVPLSASSASLHNSIRNHILPGHTQPILISLLNILMKHNVRPSVLKRPLASILNQQTTLSLSSKQSVRAVCFGSVMPMLCRPMLRYYTVLESYWRRDVETALVVVFQSVL